MPGGNECLCSKQSAASRASSHISPMHASPPSYSRPCARCPCLWPGLPMMPLCGPCMGLSSTAPAAGQFMRGCRRVAVKSGVDCRSYLSPHISAEYAAVRASPALPISERIALSPPHPKHSCLHSAWLRAQTFGSSVSNACHLPWCSSPSVCF
jgi:hypothetical protein